MNEETIAQAAELLRSGEVVALPTETVYGLAADALNPAAVAKIFAVKERPLFDPLIVHLPDPEWLERLVKIPSPELVRKLMEAFWPGPFTMVLPRRELVPDLVTAGLPRVAVRLSAHPIFRQVARAADRALAAPSANRFGRISPTRAVHVEQELGDRVKLIVDGGACAHGIESTIVSIENGGIVVLRPGPVTVEQLQEFALVRQGRDTAAPGQMPSHYAPRTPLRIVAEPEPDGTAGLLAWRDTRPGFAAIEVLSAKGEVAEAAANLFAAMRRLDALNLREIVAEPVPEQGLGMAIMDRLRRAAA